MTWWTISLDDFSLAASLFLFACGLVFATLAAVGAVAERRKSHHRPR